MSNLKFIFNETNSFYIALEGNPREIDIKKRIDYFDLSFTKWKASTKANLTDNFVHYLNDGNRGCAQSHMNLWRHVVNNNLEYALILEDDACFDKQWLTKLEQLSSDINDPEWNGIFLNVSEPMPILNKWCLVTEQYLTGGYIISNKGAKILIEQNKNFLYTSDWMTTRLQLAGHCYSYFPWLIIQEGNSSTIGTDVAADHEKVLRCLKEINYSLDNYVIKL